MLTDERYMIYRTYTPQERPDLRDRVVFYGWTRSKHIRKAFLKQRDPKKYRWYHFSDEEIAE